MNNNNDLLRPKMSEYLPDEMIQPKSEADVLAKVAQYDEEVKNNLQTNNAINTTVQETKVEENKVETKEEVKKEVVDLENTSESVVPRTARDDAFISEGFDSFVKSMNEQTTVEKESVSAEDLLKNIKIDLNSIEISSGNVLNIERTENMFKSKKVTQVVACQSAYTAFMSALNNQELQSILGSDEDYYSFRKRIIKLLFKHMEDTSIGKLDFIVWEKLTSFFDVDTLLYGVYCQTFPYENTYNIVCPNKKCGHRYTKVVNNNTIVEVRSKNETFAQLQNILKNVRTPQECMEKSLVHTTNRIVCEESKIILDLRIPSIHDYLEGMLSRVTPQYADEHSATIGLSLFVNKIYVPDLAALKDTGKLTFFEIQDPEKVFEYLDNLSFVDAEFVTNKINEFTGKYRVYYTLKNVVCPECGEVIPEVQLDMEQLLFHTLYTIKQGKK